MAKVDEINMGYWNQFLKRLDSVEEADGRSLLDHSVLAYSSSAGMDHSRDKLPTVIFGGEALGLNHQTHLALPEKTPLANVVAHDGGCDGSQSRSIAGQYRP